MMRNGAEGPEIVPDEIIQESGLGGENLAARQPPAEHAWVTEKKEQSHVDGESGAANDAKTDKARLA